MNNKKNMFSLHEYEYMRSHVKIIIRKYEICKNLLCAGAFNAKQHTNKNRQIFLWVVILFSYFHIISEYHNECYDDNDDLNIKCPLMLMKYICTMICKYLREREREISQMSVFIACASIFFVPFYNCIFEQHHLGGYFQQNGDMELMIE